MRLFEKILLRFFYLLKGIEAKHNRSLQKRRLEVYTSDVDTVCVDLNTSNISGNVLIGDNTYINAYARIVSGEISKVSIGKNCAIGRFFNCASRTHDMKRPTRTEDFDFHLRKEKDIVIGNAVWIGDNVTVREGVNIGDFAVVGANSVVTKDVKPFEVVGGVPASHIKFNDEHYLFNKV